MSTPKDTTVRTIKVTLIMCVIASLCVSLAAVAFKSRQDANKLNEKKVNVLQVAGFLKTGEKASKEKVNRLFEKIKISIVNLKTGKKVDGDVDLFDQLKSSKTEGESVALSGKRDIAGIRRLENKGLVYEVVEDGQVKTAIIPIRGYGLWSTLYGFMALGQDGNTVKGITFYQHGETPGLGGEVDNPKWKAGWIGKKIYGDGGQVVLKVVKGGANPDNVSEVDALSGATLTSRGVEHLVKFWLGKEGYGNYLQNL